MTDRDDSDAEVTPTEQASPPMTEEPSVKHREIPEAGSLEDTDEVDSPPARKWYVWVGTLSFTAIMLLLLFGPTLASLVSSTGSKRVAPEAKLNIAVPVNAPPSAPAVTLHTPVAAAPTPVFSANDEKFLLLMTQAGWGCTDNSSAEQCKEQMVKFAHQICSYSGQTIDAIYQKMALPAFLGPREERGAITKAEQAYPNCTFTGSP